MTINDGDWSEALDRAYTAHMLLTELLDDHPVLENLRVKLAYESAENATFHLYQMIGQFMPTKPITGYRVKDGKLVKCKPKMDASKAIRQKKSKRVRVVKKGQTP